jgi:hypothetical protein
MASLAFGVEALQENNKAQFRISFAVVMCMIRCHKRPARTFEAPHKPTASPRHAAVTSLSFSERGTMQKENKASKFLNITACEKRICTWCF